ncbi:hypothetical protein AAFF_G00376900 [Aldrovandia affinis]|uniref:Uncharacterized protein n=1 Tax=Aldrovandia affinis TaxID=143900 RepID=A0AAD7SFU8_9TELE|nr:hypothetical protein AAFF_G00376900 [Aldrovandia affinis]
MDGWRRLPVTGAEESKLEPSPVKAALDTETQRIKEEEVESVEPTPVIVKKEDLSDVPCKVPKFQYVDFPSLHQCIRQLAIPPLESWLAGCPAGRPPSIASRNPTERVPKFKYVDYPSLHHCIKQLSVPPLESWSSGLARSVGGRSGNRVPGSARLAQTRSRPASEAAGRQSTSGTETPSSPGPVPLPSRRGPSQTRLPVGLRSRGASVAGPKPNHEPARAEGSRVGRLPIRTVSRKGLLDPTSWPPTG